MACDTQQMQRWQLLLLLCCGCYVGAVINIIIKLYEEYSRTWEGEIRPDLNGHKKTLREELWEGTEKPEQRVENLASAG